MNTIAENQHEKDHQEEESPFHRGEQIIQSRVGKREAMENFGRRVIRSFMPEQHRNFYAELPFLVIGSVDNEGWPWASILSRRPGFISSPNPKILVLNASPIQGDPLEEAIKKTGSPLGMLGIEMITRRRNRINGRITSFNQDSFSITVDQAFGNCPQYIQHRSVDFVREPHLVSESSGSSHFSDLDLEEKKMIEATDTFFVSSFIQSNDRPDIEGVDVSHRGGRPGFVKVDGNTLTIPDYPGNSHFNTLGNFLLNPKGGLIFPNFMTGDLLMLTGTVELLWEDDKEVQAFKGSERAWRFTVDHGIKLKDALPFRARLGEFSPNSLLTGNWTETKSLLAAEKKHDVWRFFKVIRIEDESDVIRSFYLEPTDDALFSFEAGQFLSIRFKLKEDDQPNIRTYTVSSTPNESYYRISVKREEGGLISTYLHDNIKLGDQVECLSPRGNFKIDTKETRPVVLLAAGVGITPMIAMAEHLANEGILTRKLRPVTVFHSAKSTKQRAFANDFRRLEKATDGLIRYFSFISSPTSNDEKGRDFDHVGRITEFSLQTVLPLADYDFYLCGPSGFMQSLYDVLHNLGVSEKRIFAEAFGTAQLKRRNEDKVVSTSVTEEAEHATIKFTKSEHEFLWSAGEDTILETAEAHGLTPEFSCRNGICGACKVKFQSGKLTYRTKPSIELEKYEALICCAVPAENTGVIEIDL